MSDFIATEYADSQSFRLPGLLTLRADEYLAHYRGVSFQLNSVIYSNIFEITYCWV